MREAAEAALAAVEGLGSDAALTGSGGVSGTPFAKSTKLIRDHPGHDCFAFTPKLLRYLPRGALGTLFLGPVPPHGSIFHALLSDSANYRSRILHSVDERLTYHVSNLATFANAGSAAFVGVSNDWEARDAVDAAMLPAAQDLQARLLDELGRAA